MGRCADLDGSLHVLDFTFKTKVSILSQWKGIELLSSNIELLSKTI